MQDGVGTLDGSGDSLRIPEVAREDLELLHDRRIAELEAAVVVARVVADECPDRRARVDEGLSQVTADEAAGARDQDTPAVPMRFRAVCHRHSMHRSFSLACFTRVASPCCRTGGRLPGPARSNTSRS